MAFPSATAWVLSVPRVHPIVYLCPATYITNLATTTTTTTTTTTKFRKLQQGCLFYSFPTAFNSGFAGAGAGVARARLGVGPKASEEEIRKKYYRLAKACHPDLHPGNVARAEEFKALSAAVAVLLKPDIAAAAASSRSSDKTKATTPPGSTGDWDPGSVFDFVKGLNEKERAEIAEVGSTMATSGPDRGGWWAFAAMMQQQQQGQSETGSKK